jgi:glycosyltransferase involved in cell wall biosynthesis
MRGTEMAIQSPKISIMIPTYNQEAYIGQAIESALAQEYEPLEIIVSDDASTDRTPQIVARYERDHRLRYVRNKGNLGAAGNYRKCLYDDCTGSWVLNLDGDDFLSNPHYVSHAVREAQSDPSIVLVVGDRFEFDQRTHSLMEVRAGRSVPPVMDGTAVFLTYPSGGIRFHHLSALYRRDRALEVGFYRAKIASTDWESLLRLVLGGKIAYVQEVAGVWRGHGSNLSRGSPVEGRIRNLELAVGPGEFAVSHAFITRSQRVAWQRRMLRWLLTGSLRSYVASGNFAGARDYFKGVRAQFPRVAWTAIVSPAGVIAVIPFASRVVQKMLDAFPSTRRRHVPLRELGPARAWLSAR